ncbi:MAG: thiamine-phosphate kinase [Solirubrobacterales bacterium]
MAQGFTEFELIARLKAASRSSARIRTGIGDDAAVTVAGGATATSVDAVVEGTHFRREFSTPRQIATKAVAAALSDLAAMAAEPGEVYVTLGVPPETPSGFLAELSEGFLAASDLFCATLAGGDMVASPVLFASVTVVGHAESEHDLILRSGASDGDLVVVTGSLGGAAAGLWLLENQSDQADAAQREMVRRQLEPFPRLEAGQRLGSAGARAMIDVSDGLVADLGHVAEMSGVSIEIDSGLIPVQPGVAELCAASSLDEVGFTLAGGEDYELAATLPPGRFEEVRDALGKAGIPLTRIGSVTSGQGVKVTGKDGPVNVARGFDHFNR